MFSSSLVRRSHSFLACAIYAAACSSSAPSVTKVADAGEAWADASTGPDGETARDAGTKVDANEPLDARVTNDANVVVDAQADVVTVTPFCSAGAARACYNGPMGTVGVGACQPGVETCNATGTAYSACMGEVGPRAEVCGNFIDDNCNGVAEETCTSFTADVKPILEAHCASCHTTGNSGGANLASDYAATQLPSYSCAAGTSKGACTENRIKSGSMPAGAGCTGDPAMDVGKPACLNAAEQATLRAWIVDGQLP
jgi:hypothetical protein